MSFSGARRDPALVDGVNLWFRGKFNLESLIAELKLGDMKNAEEVMLSGCSAGGLSVYLQADNIAKLLPPSVKRYGVAPDDGWFLEHPNVNGTNVYPDQMKEIFTISNAREGVNQECVKNQANGEEWKCAFTEHSFRYTESPVFVMNSAYDSWQFGCEESRFGKSKLVSIVFSLFVFKKKNQGILTSLPLPVNSSQNGNCYALMAPCSYSPSQCNPQQLEVVTKYGRSFVERYHSNPNSKKRGNGAFIHSCFNHCGNFFTTSDTGFEI